MNTGNKIGQGSESTSRMITVEAGDNSQTRIVQDTPMKTQMLPGDVDDEGRNLTRKVVFKKATPKSKLLEKLQCSICQKNYESLKTLRRHARKQHNGQGVNVGAKEIDNKVTCMICKSKQQRDLISRHVINMHGFEKPEKNLVLRGFITLDGAIWKPLWMLSYEADPPVEVMVPVDQGGRIHLYGVTFEPHEVAAVDDENPIKAEEERYEEIQDEGITGNLIVDVQETIDVNVYHTNKTKIEVLDCSQKVKKSPVARNLIDEFCRGSSEDDDGLEQITNKSQVKTCDFGGPKLAVETFTVDIKDGDFWGSDIEEGDSDFDAKDSQHDIEIRLHNKSLRRAKRNNTDIRIILSELMLNASVIEDFGRYIEHKKSESCEEPSKLSTVVKAKGHLFHYDDSFLNYEYSKDPTFNLKRLVSIRDEDFLELSDPTEVGGWLDSIKEDDGKSDPGRRRECLKAHVELRNYLTEKILKADFGSTSESYLKREMVLRRLDLIKTTIESKKLFTSLSKQETKDKNERQKARKVLCPSNDFKEANCVVIWFESDVAKEEEAACTELYERSMNGRGITDKDFARFGHWGRFTIACEDRNRRAVYEFTNMEFKKRKPKWLPPKSNDDPSLMSDRFERLPSNWDADSPPEAGADASCWVIEVSGTHLKGKEDAQLVLTKRASEICLMFREMKRECKVPDDNDGPFFVNKKGKPLAKMQRTKGSLLEKFGNVCGFEKATTNSLRRAAETQIQNSKTMKQSVEKLQLHSSATGLSYYDRSAQNVRVSFVNQLSDMESPLKTNREVSSEVKKRRLEMDVEDQQTVVKEAEKLLEQSKLKRKLPRSKTNKIKPAERELMMKIYSVEVEKKFNGVFPGNYFYYKFKI